MIRTQFAGLTVLTPGESLSTDGFSFQLRNPEITDHLLMVGAVTHSHSGVGALLRPDATPSASVVASGGTLPADSVLIVGLTVTDAQGGETLISPTVSVTTPPAMAAPSSPPLASADYSGGTLAIDNYYYLRSFTDASGGETTPSPYVSVTRAPGHASGQVLLAGLTQGMTAVGATGWRLYKAGSDGQFCLLTTGGIGTDTFTDDGSVCADSVSRPRTTNTTTQSSTLLVTVPPANALPTGSVTFRVYVGIGAGFVDPSLLGEYPLASAGSTLVYLSYSPFAGRPPDTATAIGGANQIDPETDIVDFHWKRAITASALLPAGVSSDVRMATDNHRLYTPSGTVAGNAAGWQPLWTPPRRLTATASQALGASASAMTTISMAPSYTLFRCETNASARVRVYAGLAYRAADAGRASGVVPTGDHGVILDRTNSSDRDFAVAPGTPGMNLDAVSSNIPISLTNLQGATTVSVTLTYIPLE